MELKEYKSVVEAMLFASGEAVTARKLAEAIGAQTYIVEEILEILQKSYMAPEHGICLLKLDDRWQLATKRQHSEPIKKLMDNRRNAPLGPAALEVLSIIAYNQPVSRSFIEQVRGVDSSSTVTKLLEKGLIEEAGRLDLPGRPVSFRTTDVFLRTFGLSSLAQLPALHEDTPEEKTAAEDKNTGEVL